MVDRAVRPVHPGESRALVRSQIRARVVQGVEQHRYRVIGAALQTLRGETEEQLVRRCGDTEVWTVGRDESATLQYSVRQGRGTGGTAVIQTMSDCGWGCGLVGQQS